MPYSFAIVGRKVPPSIGATVGTLASSKGSNTLGPSSSSLVDVGTSEDTSLSTGTGRFVGPTSFPESVPGLISAGASTGGDDVGSGVTRDPRLGDFVNHPGSGSNMVLFEKVALANWVATTLATKFRPTTKVG
jgi:hypothetical protein